MNNLNDKIRRLSEQLLFAEKRIEYLEKFRYYLNCFHIICKCDQNIGNFIVFNDIENKYKVFLQNRNIFNQKSKESDEEIRDKFEDNYEDNNEDNISHEIEINSYNDFNENQSDIEVNEQEIKCEKLINDRKNVLSNKIDFSFKFEEDFESNDSERRTDFPSKEEFLRAYDFPPKTHILGDLPVVVKKRYNLVGFRCNYTDCDFKELTMAKVEAHVNSVHNNSKPYKCEECESSFKGKPHLHAHMRTHAVRHLVCEFADCNYKTNEARKFRIHINRHNKVRPFKCPITGCDTSYVTKCELKGHLKNRHCDEKPIICEWPHCGQRFKMISGLRSHMRTHTGERPYSCDWPGCGKTFACQSHHKRHMDIHNEIKRYECHWPDCGKRFRLSGQLKQHTWIHQGIKPISCEWPGCDRGFREKRKMQFHMEVHRKKAIKQKLSQKESDAGNVVLENGNKKSGKHKPKAQTTDDEDYDTD